MDLRTCDRLKLKVVSYRKKTENSYTTHVTSSGWKLHEQFFVVLRQPKRMIGSRPSLQHPLPKLWVAFAGVFRSELVGAEWIIQPNGETEKHKGAGRQALAGRGKCFIWLTTLTTLALPASLWLPLFA
jgi:hypothetical protein